MSTTDLLNNAGVFPESENFQNLHSIINRYDLNSRIFILADPNTEKHCLPILGKTFTTGTFQLIAIPAGETHKEISSCNIIWDRFTLEKADRSSILINLGGGMITDTGGFAASVYKRGIRFIHIPTTLLAMVDASIGGKCGINYSGFKNHLGVFQTPEAVLLYTGFLKSLPHREIKAGIAEMIKHALVSDGDSWKLMQDQDEEIFFSDEAILHSASVKVKIVSADPFEKGQRKLLNFGHTAGHAFESYSVANDKDHLLHGEAIAMGMLCESWLSWKISGLEKKALDDICGFILKHFKKYQVNESMLSEMIAFMAQDKKNRDGRINFSLLKQPGVGVTDMMTDEAVIKESLKWYIQL